jgi:integrase
MASRYGDVYFRARSKAGVAGRWHDNRHTFVTDLSEGTNSDRLIQELAGHVSRRMIERYSHVRMQARRQAIAQLSDRHEQQADTQRAEQNRKTFTAVSTTVDRPN